MSCKFRDGRFCFVSKSYFFHTYEGKSLKIEFEIEMDISMSFGLGEFGG